MKRAFPLLVIICCIAAIGCVSKKYINAKELLIKEAFTQREIPGQEGAKTYDYLKISFDLASGQNIYVDSVKFRDKMTLFNSPARNIRVKLTDEQIKTKTNTNAEKAIVYFTKDQKAYRKVIDHIGRKADLFLP